MIVAILGGGPACCTDPGSGCSNSNHVPKSGGADVARASKLHHAVERVDGDVHLGHLHVVLSGELGAPKPDLDLIAARLKAAEAHAKGAKP